MLQPDPDLTCLRLVDPTTDPPTDDTRPTDDVDPDAPVVPGFAVGRFLARGGMGAVYEATDTRLHRSVAIKTVLPGHTSADAVRQFRREAELTARFAHPGIPPVHEAGTLADGRPYLAMKLVRGRTLADLLRSPPERGELLRVFEQVCQAVAFAHRSGVIHRDLKPANVMVGAFGEVQVMDWGLARTVQSSEFRVQSSEPGTPEAVGSGEDDLTQAGTVKGTPAYMAPEQAVGRTESIGPPADVFALGGILCVILTGQPPYTGKSAGAVLAKAAAADLDSARERLAKCGADAELVALAERCLTTVAAERLADAGEVADAVAAHRAAVETRLRAAEAERAAAVVQAREQRKRRRVQLLLAGVVLLAVAGVGGLLWWDQYKQVLAERAKADALTAARARYAADLDAADDDLRAERAAEAATRLGELAARVADADAELHTRWTRRKADAELVQRLDRIDDSKHRLSRYRVPEAIDWPDGEYAAAFRECGLRVGRDDPAAVATLISDSPARDRLTAGLDEWLAVSGDPTDRGVLLKLLATLDPDPARTRFRELHPDWGNDAKRKELFALLGPPLPNWPPRFWGAYGTGRANGVDPLGLQNHLLESLRDR